MFIRELQKEILKTDMEVQLSEGGLPQTKAEAMRRCAEQLSYSRLYFNQFEAKRLEALIFEAQE